MAKTFTCSLVTPDAAVFEGQTTYANLPAHDGQMGIMPGRAPIVVKLGVGVLELTFPDNTAKRFNLDGGFAQMQDDKLTLLSEKAEAVE